MGIVKRSWSELRLIACSARLFRSLSAAGVAALILVALASCSSNRNPPAHSQQENSLNDKAVLFFSLPSTRSFFPLMLPFHTFTSFDKMAYVEVEAEGEKWKAAALKTESVGTFLAEVSSGLIKGKLLPFISVILDSSGTDYLLLVSKEGQVVLSSLKFLVEHFLVNLKAGPSVEVKIPNEWGPGPDRALFYLKIN